MMRQMAVTYGTTFIYGLRQLRPIVNVPNGARVRVRMRSDDIARAFVRQNGTTEEWLIMPADRRSLEHPEWMLGMRVSANCTI